MQSGVLLNVIDSPMALETFLFEITRRCSDKTRTLQNAPIYIEYGYNPIRHIRAEIREHNKGKITIATGEGHLHNSSGKAEFTDMVELFELLSKGKYVFR